jgi:hypothetical protein
MVLFCLLIVANATVVCVDITNETWNIVCALVTLNIILAASIAVKLDHDHHSEFTRFQWV